MLTEVKAYSSWVSAPTLPLNDTGRAETDLIQIRSIDGLDPVKASVNTSSLGAVDGSAYTGSNVISRNIILTLHPNPDWDNYTFESLRRMLYSYFMPKRPVRLVFYSDDIDPVEISGIIESAEINQFSKDPEFVVSVICPDPYFTALNPIIVTGQTIRDVSAGVQVIPYNGSVEAGIKVKVSWTANPVPIHIGIQIGDPAIEYFDTAASVNSGMFFEMCSIPMQKYVQNVGIGSGIITNLLSKAVIREGSTWPIFQPGDNEFAVITDQGVQDWELTYYERFGGL